MDKSKNLLQDMMNNWLASTQKFQESLQQKNNFDKNVDFYNTWYEGQKKMMEALTGNNKPKDPLEQMMEAQQQMGKNWLNAWQEMGKNWGGQSNKLDASTQLQDTWNQIYSQWTRQFGQPFGAKQKGFEGSPMEVFGQIMNTTHTYMKMYEAWQPILENLQKQKGNLEQMTELLNASKFQETIEEMFTSITPKQSEAFFEQINNFTLSLLDSLKDVGGQVSDKFDRLAHLIPNTLSAEMNGSQEMGYEIYSNLQKGLAPMFTMIPPSKEKDMVILMLQIQENYMRYYVKSNEIKTLVTTTATKAMEKTLKQVVENTTKKPEPIVFDDVFNAWVDTTENDMIELYHSEAFSQLQGDMLTIGSQIKKHLDQHMEEVISHLPIAPRSEIDEMNAIIHELRGKMRSLEKELKATQNENALMKKELEKLSKAKATPAKATATKTATTKASTKKTTTTKASTSTTAKKASTSKAKATTQNS